MTSRLVIINDVSRSQGGATKVALACIDAALKANIEVGALLGDDGTGISERFPSVHIEALGQRPLRESSGLRDTVTKVYSTEARRKLEALLDWAGPDAVVHIHTWSQILSPSIFHTLARHPGRIIVTAHDFFLNCPNGGFINYPSGEICHRKPMSLACLTTQCDKRWYGHKAWRALRQGIQNAAGHEFWARVEVLLVYDEMRAFMPEFPEKNVRIVRNFVEPYLKSPVDSWTKSGLVFLGRMTKEKGVETLIEALETSGRHATLIGKGPLLEEARRRLPHCDVMGWVDDAQLQDIFANARAVLFTSLMPEPYGLVVGEAVLSGIPVIVSDNALISKEVEASGFGISFRGGDAQSLINAMAALDDPDLTQRFATNARENGHTIAMKRQDWMNTMTDCYQQVPT